MIQPAYMYRTTKHNASAPAWTTSTGGVLVVTKYELIKGYRVVRTGSIWQSTLYMLQIPYENQSKDPHQRLQLCYIMSCQTIITKLCVRGAHACTCKNMYVHLCMHVSDNDAYVLSQNEIQ